MGRITFPFLNFNYYQGFLLTKQYILHSDLWRISFYVHICSSFIVLIAGFLQFSSWLLKKFPVVHRFIGKCYVLLVLFLSAPSGLIMGYHANGGWLAKSSFMTIAILWWVFTYMAYRRIRKLDFQSHIHWMIRSYALTLSAITLRTYAFLLPASVLQLSAKDAYTFVALLSWIPNLLVAEWIIRVRAFNKPI